MYPRLYNSSDALLAVLDNVIKDTAKIKRVVNGEFTFAFSAYEKELKSEYFDTDNYILLNDQTFDIKYIEQKHEESVIYTMQCEHAIYRLEDGVANQYETYAYTGTPAAMLGDVISGTDFTVGTVDFTDPITISINNEISKKALIKQIANAVGGELEYTDNGFTINILATIGQDNGFQVRFGKNLKSVTKVIDKRGELKTYYKIDMIALKNTNAYIEKGLQDLEVVEVGDTIKIIDSVIGLEIENRILSIEYNPILEVNTKLEIVNTIELITDKITEIETRSVAKEVLYNGVYIGPTDGFVAERSDNKAKTVMNATTGLSLYTDNGTGYTENFLVTPAGNINMTGVINITGGSGIGSLDDAGALAILDTVGNTQIDSNSISTSKLQANSISSDKILANAVTASKISVTQLDAISANVGTLTTGTINGLNIYGANIDIDEDVKIGQKLKLLNSFNNSVAEFGTFRVLGTTGIVDSLYLAGQLNTVSGGLISKSDLPRMDIFCDTTLFYGDVSCTGDFISDDITSNGYITADRSGSIGGYVFTNNGNDERTVQIGTNSGDGHIPGLILLYNGKTGDSESRLSLGVSTISDKGYINIYTGDVLTTAINSFADGGYIRSYDSLGNDSTYLGVNSSSGGNGLLILYDGSENPTVSLYADATNGGALLLKYGTTSGVVLRTDADYGSFLYMYNDLGNQVVRLGSSASAATHGSLWLSDLSGNVRAKLRVSTSLDDGRLDLYTSGGSLATLYFDGANIRVTIGGTNYTLTKT